MKNRKPKNTKPGVRNAGRGGFNRGSKLEDEAKKVIFISDKEKLTGHRRFTFTNKQK